MYKWKHNPTKHNPFNTSGNKIIFVKLGQDWIQSYLIESFDVDDNTHETDVIDHTTTPHTVIQWVRGARQI